MISTQQSGSIKATRVGSLQRSILAASDKARGKKHPSITKIISRDGRLVCSIERKTSPITPDLTWNRQANLQAYPFDRIRAATTFLVGQAVSDGIIKHAEARAIVGALVHQFGLDYRIARLYFRSVLSSFKQVGLRYALISAFKAWGSDNSLGLTQRLRSSLWAVIESDKEINDRELSFFESASLFLSNRAVH